MVIVKFKPEVPPAQIDELLRQVGELQSLIPGITYFASGPYSSPEGLNQGYTHGFLLTFSHAAARDAYLPHPEHERVKAAVIPYIDGVIAFDFEAP